MMTEKEIERICEKYDYDYVSDTLDARGEIVPVFFCPECKERTTFPEEHKKQHEAVNE